MKILVCLLRLFVFKLLESVHMCTEMPLQICCGAARCLFVKNNPVGRVKEAATQHDARLNNQVTDVELTWKEVWLYLIGPGLIKRPTWLHIQHSPLSRPVVSGKRWDHWLINEQALVDIPPFIRPLIKLPLPCAYHRPRTGWRCVCCVGGFHFHRRLRTRRTRVQGMKQSERHWQVRAEQYSELNRERLWNLDSVLEFEEFWIEAKTGNRFQLDFREVELKFNEMRWHS